MGQDTRRPSKVNRPTYSKVLPRERLFTILDGETADQLVWVSGIAGSGKTILVSTYIEHRNRPSIWYQMDENDEDPATFFNHLALALKNNSSKSKKSLPEFTATYCPDLTAFTHRFFEVFFSNVDPHTLIVFDGYPDAPGEFIRHVIPNALSRIPAGLKIVVISRSLPPSSLSVVRVNRHMKEVMAEDLKLDMEEFLEVADLYGIRGLSGATMARMHNRMEGWVSGLVLMAESIRRTRIDLEKAVGTNIREIYDFFMGEIEKSLDGETREFLLKTSFLPDINIESARSLTGHEHPERILDDLCNHNFFTSRKKQQHAVYQYHSMFKEYLQGRARDLLPAQQYDTLRKQAAHLLWKADRLEQAASLLHHMGEWEELTAIILARARKIADEGRYQALQALLNHIPEEKQRKNHRVLYWKAICELPFNPADSRSYFTRSLELARKAGDAKKSYLSWAGIVQSVLFDYDNFYELDRLIDDFEDLRSRFPEYPSRDVEARVAYCMLMALIFRRIEYPGIEDWMRRSTVLANEIGSYEDRIMTGMAEAMVHFYRGNMIEMGHVVESRIEPFAKGEICGHIQPLVHYQVALKEWMKGSCERSGEIIESGLKIADTMGVHLWDLALLGQGVASGLCGGDVHRAGGYLELMKEKITGASKQDRSHFHYLSGWEAAVRGDLPLAGSHVKKALDLKMGVGIPFNIARNSLALAEVQHGLGEGDQALELLASARKIAEKTGNRYLLFHCDLVEAGFALDGGNEPGARKFLERCMVIGAESGIYSYFWMRADHLGRLCSLALKHSIQIPYVKGLVSRHNLLPGETHMEGENWPWPVKIYALGRFEVQVRGKTVPFSGKAQERPISLLKALLAHGGRKVPAEKLLETLWPDSDSVVGHRTLTAMLYRLKRIIDVAEAVIHTEGEVSLNPHLCWVDFWAVEQAMDWLDNRREDEVLSGEEKPGILPQVEDGLRHYRGHFLSGDGSDPWISEPRERLKSRFIRALENYCNHLESKGEDERAGLWHQRVLELVISD